MDVQLEHDRVFAIWFDVEVELEHVPPAMQQHRLSNSPFGFHAALISVAGQVLIDASSGQLFSWWRLTGDIGSFALSFLECESQFRNL